MNYEKTDRTSLKDQLEKIKNTRSNRVLKEGCREWYDPLLNADVWEELDETGEKILCCRYLMSAKPKPPSESTV